MSAVNQENLANFFNDSLLGDDEDEDIDKIKWVTAFNRLSINMTKKDVIKIFDFIDEEQTGYVDRFDFMDFCNTEYFDNDPKHTMKHLKEILIQRIEAFLRFSQIGKDGSIEIIYSKHTVNPCKPIKIDPKIRRRKTSSMNFSKKERRDPYYHIYYDDDIFHEFDPEELAMDEIKSFALKSFLVYYVSIS